MICLNPQLSTQISNRLSLTVIADIFIATMAAVWPSSAGFYQCYTIRLEVVAYTMQEALAVSLWLVAANDVPISAAYKVNPILVSHSGRAREQGWQWLREAWAGNGNHNAFHKNIKKYLDVQLFRLRRPSVLKMMFPKLN